MKSIIFVIYLSFLASITFGQERVQLFKSLDKKELISRLFSLSTYNSRQEAVWKPDSLDNPHLPVSSDGFCYTKLDTFIFFKDKNPVKRSMIEKVAVVFVTSRYQDDELDNCHACAPAIGVATYTKTASGMWKLDQFNKFVASHGSWGKRGKMGVERFCDALFCLKLEANFYGQGNTEGIVSYFSLSGKINEVLSFQSHVSNDGAVEHGFLETTTLTKIPETKGCTLELTTSRDNPQSVKKRIYRYSPTNEIFELTK
jgi:hypothetical protein